MARIFCSLVFNDTCRGDPLSTWRDPEFQSFGDVDPANILNLVPRTRTLSPFFLFFLKAPFVHILQVNLKHSLHFFLHNSIDNANNRFPLLTALTTPLARPFHRSSTVQCTNRFRPDSIRSNLGPSPVTRSVPSSRSTRHCHCRALRTLPLALLRSLFVFPHRLSSSASSLLLRAHPLAWPRSPLFFLLPQTLPIVPVSVRHGSLVSGPGALCLPQGQRRLWVRR